MITKTDTAAHRFAYVLDTVIAETGETPEAVLDAMRNTGSSDAAAAVRPMTPRLMRWLSRRGTPSSWEVCEDGITIDLIDADARVEAVDRFAEKFREMSESDLLDARDRRGRIPIAFAAARDDESAPWEYSIGIGIEGSISGYRYDGDREAFIKAMSRDAGLIFDIDIECSLD